MPSYQQKKRCQSCGAITTAKVCGKCNTPTTALSNWSVIFRIVNSDYKQMQKRLSGFKRKSDAERAYRDYMATYTPPAAINNEINAYTLTFSQLYEKYKKYCETEIKESSLMKNINKADKHILPYFGSKIVGKINERDILEWKQKINKTTYIKFNKNIELAFKSKKTIYGILIHILNFAVKYYELKYNVAIKVGNFKDKSEIKKEMSFWTYAEYLQFIDCADDVLYKAVFDTLYYTGMRKGELMALQWKDIDFVNKTIRINKTASRTANPEMLYAITSPKSKNSTRVIAITNNLSDELKSLYEFRCEQELIDNNHFVFGGARVMPQQNIANYMNRWIDKSGVKKIRVHDLRHSHVSLLISNGSNALSLVYVIAKRIGDSTEQIFETYGHLFPNDEQKVLSNLNDFIESKNICD